ncbi:MAG: hypothetical protein ACK5M3_05485 [Dysgonomonas sp.]
MANEKYISKYKSWQADWNKFVREVLKARLDQEQQDIITSVQMNPLTAVASGTARGKDFVAACAVLCFMYLTPKFNAKGELIENTKIALTAPTGRQVSNIMTPEVRRLYRNAKVLPGRLVADDIRTNYEEWFLTGFKADDNATEAWSGFHAVNTMFAITEATGISQKIFDAIEGNLQGNSRMLIVFNPNVTTGYAAQAMKSDRFTKFRLNSLNAENVVSKKNLIPGQVDYAWVKDKVLNWCTPITDRDFNKGEGDFQFEIENESGKLITNLYRPNDLFRVKVLGMFPKVAEDILIPYEWIELANQRWQEIQEKGFDYNRPLRLGSDIAGMGRDSSVNCYRYDNYVDRFYCHNSGGKADHMHMAGLIANELKGERNIKNIAIIDTIGEGAGVYSRLEELYNEGQIKGTVISSKGSQGTDGLTDSTGQLEFANMRAYLHWCVREWLDPKNNHNPALPPCDKLMEEATETHWKFQSNGKIIIEPKDDIQERIGRSPDFFDALKETFYPVNTNMIINDQQILNDFR